MEIGNTVKHYRKEHSLTQEQLGKALGVSSKTISSWENNRTFPDIEMVVQMSNVFDLTLDTMLKEDHTLVQKIAKDGKEKSIYKWALIMLITTLAGITLFFYTFQYKHPLIDRINPFLKYETGYATLPEKATYNSGKPYIPKSTNTQTADPYKDIFVVDDPFGNGMYLTFTGGQSPENKHYAIVNHKGTFVKVITFIAWEDIPSIYQNTLEKTYTKDARPDKDVIKATRRITN